ncbi:hypothetical protein BC940DRAFT_330386 [Gongronella butleri]|nr:hypothetical protein BC940DRAFT_330386 [Gongronella butleri]
MQPRPTKASMLRAGGGGGASASAAAAPSSSKTQASAAPPSNKSKGAQQSRASDGVRAFVAAQRSRLQQGKKEEVKKTAFDDDKDASSPFVKRGTSNKVMTGAQRYGGGDPFEAAPVAPDLSNLKGVIQRAKTSGHLNIANRALQHIPDQIITMYHVDPKSIVVDFSSSDHAWYDDSDLTKLIASDNHLQAIDDRLGTEFGALSSIDFRNNALNALPESFARLQQLSVLDLSHNQFATIPAALYQLPKLRDLNMAHNALTTIPDDVGAMTHLEVINFNNNSITALPHAITQWTRLQKLSLDHNQLTELSLAWLAAMPHLFDVSLLHNRIATLETEGESVTLPRLQRLDLRRNRLSELPSAWHMPKLKELLLSSNDLHTSSGAASYEVLAHCPELLTLDVASNQWTSIPDAVMALQSLQRLDIGANHLTGLRSDFGKLSELKVLTWEGNPLRSVPRGVSMAQLIDSLSIQPGVQEENEENVAIAADADMPLAVTSDKTHTSDPTPAKVQTISSTPNVNLSRKQLDTMEAAELSKYHGVKTLEMHDNAISVVSLASLALFAETLVSLNFDGNKLTTFSLQEPEMVFPCVKSLTLANNRLASLVVADAASNGAATSSFPALTDLNLNNNVLSALPAALSTHVLPQLRKLLVNGNRLAELDPDSVANVHVLDVGNNDLAQLPPRLGLNPNLTELIAYGNRFRVPQPALLAQGTAAVIAFLRRRAGVADA